MAKLPFEGWPRGEVPSDLQLIKFPEFAAKVGSSCASAARIWVGCRPTFPDMRFAKNLPKWYFGFARVVLIQRTAPYLVPPFCLRFHRRERLLDRRWLLRI